MSAPLLHVKPDTFLEKLLEHERNVEAKRFRGWRERAGIADVFSCREKRMDDDADCCPMFCPPTA